MGSNKQSRRNDGARVFLSTRWERSEQQWAGAAEGCPTGCPNFLLPGRPLHTPTLGASHPVPSCPYPTQARLAVAEAPPAEAGTLPGELLGGLQERKPRVPEAPAGPWT